LQSTLLGFALGIIAAIVAAFVAPFFIDWNEWRPQFEAQASTLAGTRVTIAGKIEAILLPTPQFVLREVSFGDPEGGTGVRANEVRGALSLTALLTGRFEASEFIVSRPAIRVAIGKDGKLVLPAGASIGQEVSVGGFVFEAGSLIVEDRRSNSLLLADDFSARGELLSREGPFRIDAGFRLNGMRWILRASSTRFSSDHAARIRFALERPGDSVSFEAEGLLAIANAAPRFDGKVVAVRRAGALPWRFASDAAGDASEIRFSNLELALGDGDNALSFAGSGRIAPRPGGALDISLASKRLDFDRGDPQAANKGAAQALPLLFEARQLLAALPFNGRIAVAADGITAGGQLTRDLRANIVLRAESVTFDQFEARLPGRASISLAGSTKDDTFSGSLSLESEEPQSLLRWLAGQEQAEKFGNLESLHAKGAVTFTPKEFSFRGIDAVFGAAKITGSIALRQAENPPRPVLELRLVAGNADLDPALPFLKSVLDGQAGIDLVAELSAAEVRVFGKAAKLIGLSFATSGGEVSLSRFILDEFDGLSVAAKRAAGDRNRLDFTANASRTGGLAALLEYFSGSAEFGVLMGKYSSSNLPLKISGWIEPAKADWRASISSGDMQLEGLFGPFRDNRRAIDATLRLPDTEVAVKGDMRFGAKGEVEPTLALAFKTTDLRNAFAAVMRASATPVSAIGKANLIRDSNFIVFDALTFDLLGTRGSGRIAIPLGETGPFSGQLVLDRANAAPLATLALGLANPSGEFSVPALANIAGSLRVEVASLVLTDQVGVSKARFNLRAGRSEFVIDDLAGEIAGGKISGTLRFADTAPRAVEVRLDIADAKLSELLVSSTARGVVRGTLVLGAGGNTRDALLASLSGQGTISVSGFELDQAEPAAVAAVFAASANSAPEDAAIERALATMFARGTLKLMKLESQIVVANGIFRADQFRAKSAATELSASAVVNLPKKYFDGAIAMETPGDSTIRPGAIIRWQGPLDAPERKTDARALITAITLRAIERGVRNPSTQINLPLPEQELMLPSSAPNPKRRPVKSERPAKADRPAAVPVLPPPVNILPAPGTRQQQRHREFQN
jgi:hypothetical protein